MIEFRPTFLTKNGKKEFAVLSYEEFLKIKQLLEYLEDLEDLKEAKEEEKDSPSYSLDEVKKMLNMDKITHDQSLIKKILLEYEKLSSQVTDPDIDETLIFDDLRSQYLWFNIGWKNGERVKAISVYVRIKNDKIWIEEDWTEEGIANELLRGYVPKEDIVLAFYDPETRKHTDFEIA